MTKDDKKVVEQLLNEKYGDWISNVRELLCQEDSPLSLKNGTWSVKKRQELWDELGPYLFDEHLDKFKQIVVEVLREPDPQFDLKPDERYMSNIRGKVLKHSNVLRKGLAESLALLGTQPDVLKNCSRGKAESIAFISVREIFTNSDWVLWASLNILLPTLAEAAPEEFLSAVENALQKTPCPFDEIFSQEGKGIFGNNYMTGLLWALETLAWDTQYLVRVTIILGKLASRDPGGNWGNRPANSLSTIFLPWFPQTIASVEKRKVAVQTLLKEFPDVGWKLLLNLLPNVSRSSCGSHKPEWRKIIPDDWEKGVTNKEYWEQVVNYSEIAVETAKSDATKIKALIAHLRNLAKPSFNALLEYLETEEVKKLSEEERTVLWDALAKIVIRHKRHSDEKWAFTPETTRRIENIAESLRAQSPQNRYRYLFSNRDIELYEEKGNYEEQEKKLEVQRQDAIKEILEEGGIEAVLRFSESVNAPRRVGYSLGSISKNDIDGFILPNLIADEDGKNKEFTSAFVFAKYNKQGWDWVNQTEIKKWPKEKIGMFLSYLPSNNETWDYVAKILEEHEDEYWKRAGIFPYDDKSNWNHAVEKLIEHKRPNAAITCLSVFLYKKKKINCDLAIKALLGAITTEEPVHTFDAHYTVEVIKALQDNPEVNPDVLFSIEWAYLQLLTGPGNSGTPKLLEQKLASEPDFFCELIRRIYSSKKEPDKKKEATEQEKAIATNAWHLFREWKRIPGTDSEHNLLPQQFKKWLKEVKTKCKESGHFDVAMITLGEALIHSPPDPDGLWIHKTVAEVLNSEDAEPLRRGYYLGIVNARGCHWVDSTGKPEKELAAKYQQQAEEVENFGFHRFASKLRDLAKNYEEQAKQIIEEHSDLVKTDKNNQKSD